MAGSERKSWPFDILDRCNVRNAGRGSGCGLEGGGRPVCTQDKEYGCFCTGLWSLKGHPRNFTLQNER